VRPSPPFNIRGGVQRPRQADRSIFGLRSSTRCSFHFDSLAHDNDALSSTVEGAVVPGASDTPPAPSPPNQPVAWTLKGRQSVRKFNKTEEDAVAILMAVWRIAGACLA
jgi:hypothetical protein